MKEDIKNAIRDINDFPKKGIIFKDINPVLQDPKLFSGAIDLMSLEVQKRKPSKIVGIDARGFIFGAAIAHKLKLGFVPVRKLGKLPYKTYSESYSLEYGENTLEIHQDAISHNDTIVVVDDLLATGGTLKAAINLIKKCGASTVSVNVFIELSFLKGRKNLNNTVSTIITY